MFSKLPGPQVIYAERKITNQLGDFLKATFPSSVTISLTTKIDRRGENYLAIFTIKDDSSRELGQVVYSQGGVTTKLDSSVNSELITSLENAFSANRCRDRLDTFANEYVTTRAELYQKINYLNSIPLSSDQNLVQYQGDVSGGIGLVTMVGVLYSLLSDGFGKNLLKERFSLDDQTLNEVRTYIQKTYLTSEILDLEQRLKF